MTENEARKIMERARDSGSPLPNIAEYSEALRKTYEILGSNYTEKQLDNWILVGKYPFLLPTYWNRDSMQYKVDEDYTYKYTELDAMPDGWRKAFGEMMCEEIYDALVECGGLDDYRIEEIKEKFGQLRWYGYPSYKEVSEIIDKYSVLSENICIICGKPDVPMIGTLPSYISPYCKKCFTTPDDWYKEEHPDKIDAWIKNHAERWEEYNDEEDNKMYDCHHVTTWSKEKGEETIEYDISETANKIRAKWRVEHGE